MEVGVVRGFFGSCSGDCFGLCLGMSPLSSSQPPTPEQPSPPHPHSKRQKNIKSSCLPCLPLDLVLELAPSLDCHHDLKLAWTSLQSQPRIALESRLEAKIARACVKIPLPQSVVAFCDAYTFTIAPRLPKYFPKCAGYYPKNLPHPQKHNNNNNTTNQPRSCQ